MADVLADFSLTLRDELDYRLDLMADAAADDGEPFVRDSSAVLQVVRDLDAGGFGQWRNELRRWLIARGVYVSVTDHELALTTVTGGRKYDFRLDGVKYRFEQWR